MTVNLKKIAICLFALLFVSLISLTSCIDIDLIAIDLGLFPREDIDYGKEHTVILADTAGLAMEELTIPNKYQGCAVKQIAANAFSGSSELKKLFVGTNISFISAEAFSGASSLTEVYLPDGKRPADISVPNSMANALATKGCNPDLRIFVDADKFEGYIADYNWGDYSDFLAKKDS